MKACAWTSDSRRSQCGPGLGLQQPTPFCSEGAEIRDSQPCGTATCACKAPHACGVGKVPCALLMILIKLSSAAAPAAEPLPSPLWALGLALFAALLLVRGHWALLLQWASIMGLLAASWLLGEVDSAADAGSATGKAPRQLTVPARLLSAVKGKITIQNRCCSLLQVFTHKEIAWSNAVAASCGRCDGDETDVVFFGVQVCACEVGHSLKDAARHSREGIPRCLVRRRWRTPARSAAAGASASCAQRSWTTSG